MAMPESVTASCSSFCIDTVSALCFSGRLNVTRYTGPLFSTRKSSSNSMALPFRSLTAVLSLP